MKKRIMAILMCAVLALTLAACGNENDSTGDDGGSSGGGKNIGKNVSAPAKPVVPTGQAAPETDFEFNNNSDDITITKYLGKDETVFIPSQIGGKNVRILGIYFKNGVFEKNSTLKRVIIPEPVFKIENFAFRGCDKLTEVYLPDTLWCIGNGAFMGCTSLTTVYLPENLNEIEVEAFFACTGLTNIYIPDSVTKIGLSAFEKCPNLTVYYKGKTYTQDNFKDLYTLAQ